MAAPESLEARRLLADDSPLRFAVIGDYGYDLVGASVGQVAGLVKSWSPDLVITVGDNNYPFGEASTIDRNIGKHYQEFIANYQGDYGAGALDGVNRFFPSLGNHDWYAAEGAPLMPAPYLNYFTLPGNERYYDFVRGPVHFFAIDSDVNEPDGNTATSLQAQWLKDALARSTSPWKVVYFHHAPFSSGAHGPDEAMQWPFRQWGADAVLTGHDHTYERIIEPATGLPYFVNGLGGNSMYPFLHNAPGSVVRYNADFGAMKVDATDAKMTFQFITRGGQLIDSYTLMAADTPPPAPAEVTAVAVGPTQINLVWEDVAGDEGGYVIERADAITGFKRIAEVGPGVTRYRDRGLPAGGEFSYRVRAFNSAGSSLPAPTAVASTPPGGPEQLAAPAGLTAVATSDTGVSLSWPDVAGEEGYVLEHSLDGIGFTQIADLPEGTINRTATGLSPDTLHYFRLRAYGEAGESADVDDTVTTLPGGPTVDIIDVAPDPRQAPVNVFVISFSRPVSGFDVSDLELTRNGGGNLLGPDQVVLSNDGGLTWSLLGATELTASPGRYRLILRGGAGSGIDDAQGIALARGAGEAWEMRTAAVAAPPAPDLEAASDSGPRADDNATTDDTPTFVGAAPAGSTVKLYANGVEVGSGLADGGAYRVTTVPLADGLYSISGRIVDLSGNASPYSISTTLRIDRVLPRLQRVLFNQSLSRSATVRSIAATFSEQMVIRPQDLLLWNRSTNTVVSPASYALSYDAQSRTATWTFPGLPGGLLPDGDYFAAVAPVAADAAGNAFDGNGDGVGGDAHVFYFHQLAGDATGDRIVDHHDFAVLREHFGFAGTSEQGDFTGDGRIDFGDFQFLERRFGQTLPAAQLEPAPAPIRAATVRQAPRKPAPTPRVMVTAPRFSTQRV